MAAILTISLILAGFALVFLFFFPLARGAIYVASSPEKTLFMVELSGAEAGERAADLGSGDGRIVIALARRGLQAHGFEINPILVLVARWKIRRAGLEDRAFIHWKSFWRADLSAFNVVILFQGSAVMRRLEMKVRRELAPGSRVISDYWGFPTMKAERVCATVLCYRIGSFDREA